MTPETHTIPIQVLPEHIDVRNHVNNLVYLEWCLHAAETHWEKNTDVSLRANYVWYVLEHTITYKKAALEGDHLEVNTWVEASNGVKSERCYNIVRPKDNALLVKAKTLWCLLDAHTLKPMLIPEEIRTLFLK